MKTFLIAALCLLSLIAAPLAHAGTVVYTATMSGIDCNGCKKTISKSLARIKGVQKIQIVKVGNDRHRLTVHTDGTNPISMSRAQSAIRGAEHYKILSWSK